MAEMTITGSIAATTVAEAAAGDRDALARIVGAHHDDMARICFVICGDQDQAQDAVQAAWPVAWRKLDTLRDPDRLRPWLMAVAANEARQILRRRQRHQVVEIDVADISSERLDPRLARRSSTSRRALRRSSPDDRTLLALRYVAGFDAAEIATALGMSASGVRSRLSRLIQRCERSSTMPETTFEAILATQLRTYAEGGVRPVDRYSIADATLATRDAAPPPGTSLGWLSRLRPSGPATLRLGLVLLLALLIAAAAFTFGAPADGRSRRPSRFPLQCRRARSTSGARPTSRSSFERSPTAPARLTSSPSEPTARSGLVRRLETSLLTRQRGLSAIRGTPRAMAGCLWVSPRTRPALGDAGCSISLADPERAPRFVPIHAGDRRIVVGDGRVATHRRRCSYRVDVFDRATAPNVGPPNLLRRRADLRAADRRHRDGRSAIDRTSSAPPRGVRPARVVVRADREGNRWPTPGARRTPARARPARPSRCRVWDRRGTCRGVAAAGWRGRAPGAGFSRTDRADLAAPGSGRNGRHWQPSPGRMGLPRSTAGLGTVTWPRAAAICGSAGPRSGDGGLTGRCRLLRSGRPIGTWSTASRTRP